MKRYSQIARVFRTLTPVSEFTRHFLEQTNKLSEEFRDELLKKALVATQENLGAAKKNMITGRVNSANAEMYYKEAINTAELIFKDNEMMRAIKEDGKKILSEAYSGYAEFLRKKTPCEEYEIVNALLDNALILNPKNNQAIDTRDDIKFTFKHT